ncbi:MAG: 3-oxoacyl-ACP synthase [Polyangiaceae bacterium]|nr:3-oxoacyl-ACP synthase [Polyangiaceae bacterium]
MRPAAILAFGAVSASGTGLHATGARGLGARASTRVREDAALAEAGVRRPACARVSDGVAPVASDRRADAVLTLALDACVAALDERAPGWRSLTIGLALGTSSGAMQGASRAYGAISAGRAPDRQDAEDLAYAAPFLRARARLGVPLARSVSVLGACASSTLAIGLGALWLDAGECDVVLAGGYDVVTPFVAAGFASLGAVTRSAPGPFRQGRDGLALGEGAAILALVRDRADALAFVTGFGAASDAGHLTAPDRDGRGLVRACRAALSAAALEPADVGLVSAHGTATVFNDAAEARAIQSILGEASPLAHALKGELGHTLGAAGALETLAAAASLARGVAQPSAGQGPVDPDAALRVLDVGESCDAAHALKTSVAFGGLNAALTVSRLPREGASEVRRVAQVALASVSLAEAVAPPGVPPERAARWDDLTRLVVAAASRLASSAGLSRGDDVAVIVGHVAATVTTNTEVARRAAEGRPEPRRFPFTSPNACAGEASSVLGLVGAAFAVGGAPGLGGQAEETARDLVAHGLARAALAIEVDDESPTTSALLAAHGAPMRSASARGVLLVADQGQDLLHGARDGLVSER